MSQSALFVTCWLLAVGRGSGVLGPTYDTPNTSTSQPGSQRPSPFPSAQPGPDQVDRHTISLMSTPLTFYPLHMNSSQSPPRYDSLTDPMTNPGPFTSTASSTTSPTRPTTTSTTTQGTMTAQWSAQSTSPPSPSPTRSMKIPTSPTTTAAPLNKEQVREVPPSSQKEWFVRRKHKGPYFSSRVKTLSVILKGSHRNDDKSVKNHSKGQNSLNHPKNVSHVLAEKSADKRLKANRRDKLSKFISNRQHLSTSSTPNQNQTKRLLQPGRARKRPISMGIPASSTVLQSRRATTTTAPTDEPYNPPDSDEYYSSYAEYPDLPVLGMNGSVYSEAAVLPDPDVSPREEDTEAEDEIEAEAEVVLPDDSLADTDLHDHDLIDSVMYIYFGSSERDERGAGRQVLIVGAVISLVAQFLTLVSVLRRLRLRPDESASLILLNAELALTTSNLVFMLGVQATGSRRRCEVIAVTLHYLHLVACCWFLVNSMFSYTSLQQTEARRRLRPWWLAAWCVPLIIVLGCVVFNRRGYETRSFCWVSVARGMLYSFMVPVAFLILLNTCFAVLGMRQLSLSSKPEDNDRKSMRVSAILLPVFSIVWFLGVVALENSASLVFPLLFVASSGFLNWFVLACWLPADLSLWRESDEDFDDDDDDLYEEVLKTHTDSQPLLEEPAVYVCGRRDLCELQMDPICTISS